MNAFQLFRMISLHHIWRNKLRTLFVLFIVIIGSVSMFTAVDAIFKRNDSRRFGTTLFHGQASISLETMPDESMPDNMLDRVRATDGVAVATPLVVDGGLLLNQSLLLPLIGIDPDTELMVRPHTLIEGDFITETGQILITDVFAEDIAVGDTVRIAGKGGLRSYTVAGILAQESIAALNGGDMLFLHYEDVQDIRRNDSIDYISVVPSENIDTTIANLESQFSGTLKIENINDTGDKTLTDYVVDVLGIISNGLPAILGALMITSTMAAGVAQRRKELAILRSIGTTQRGILSILIVEAAVLGLIGSIFGLGLAVLLNQGGLNAPAEIESFNAVATQSVTPLWIYGFVTVTGVAMAVAAMWIPARQATSIDPTEAMRPTMIKAESGKVSKTRFILGVTFLILAVVCRIAFDNSQLVPMAVLTGILFVLIGILLVFPPLVLLTSRFIPKIMQRAFGFSGMIASENMSMRHQRAIATGLTALLVIWFHVLFMGFTAGQKYLVQQLVDAEYNWDLIISGPGEDARDTVSSIPAEVVDTINTSDDVAVLAKERLASYTYQETDFTIRAVDLDTYFGAGASFAWENGNETQAYQRLLDHDNPAVLVGGFEALLSGMRRVDTTITLSTPSGDVEFDVVGTINAPGGNTILMDYDLYSELWNNTQVDRMSINLTDTADAEELRRSLSNQYRNDGLIVTDRDEIRALFGANFPDAAGAIVTAILFPFMMLGIANMLFISVLDRQREFGMLRAIGTLRNQIVWSVIIEAVIIVLLASCLAIPTAYLTMETMLFERIAGADVRPDVLLIVQAVLSIIVAAIIAAYLPARRASRLDILEALRYE